MSKMTLQELVAGLPGDDLSVLIQERVGQVNEGFAEMATELKNLREDNQNLREFKKGARETLVNLERDLSGAKSLAANRDEALKAATEDYAELRKVTEAKLASFKKIIESLESKPKEQLDLTWVILWLHEGNMMKRIANDEDEAKNFYGLLGKCQKALFWTYAFSFDGIDDLLTESFVKSLERKVRLNMKALGMSDMNSDEVLIPDEVADLLQTAREELLESGSTSEVLHRIESMLIEDEPVTVNNDDDQFGEK